MAKNPTYYEILGVNKEFTELELRTALASKINYIKRAFDGDDIEIKKKIDMILNIYNILSDAERKRKYDYILDLYELHRKEQYAFKKLKIDLSAKTIINEKGVVVGTITYLNPNAFKILSKSSIIDKQLPPNDNLGGKSM